MIDQATSECRVDQLDPADREAIALAYFDGADYQTIARVQDEDPADTLGRLTRALDALVGDPGSTAEASR